MSALEERPKGSPRKRAGRPFLPKEPNLTELDAQILQLAGVYKSETGKSAARGAIGRRFTNQAGPFVKFVMQKLKMRPGSEAAIVARIKRFERHPRLRSYWYARRTPTRIIFADFLKSQGI